MCGLTEQQRCEFAENALAERQAVLASLHQHEQQFARWIAHQRQYHEDVPLLLVRQLKQKVAQRAAEIRQRKRALMRFLDLPRFRHLVLRQHPIAPNSTEGFVPLPDLPAFKGEPLDTRYLHVKG